jgi:hypothetical protein
MVQDDEDDKPYAVTDIRKYRSMIAKEVADLFGIKDPVEVFNFITSEQMSKIIDEGCLGHTEDGLVVVSANVHIKITNNIYNFVQSGVLAKMASDGILECAWDDQQQDMVYWLSENGGSDD